MVILSKNSVNNIHNNMIKHLNLSRTTSHTAYLLLFSKKKKMCCISLTLF